MATDVAGAAVPAVDPTAVASGYDAGAFMPFVVTFIIAIAFPIILIAVRHQVRVYRIRLIELYESKYGLKGNDSFEIVKEKYLIDIGEKSRQTTTEDPAADRTSYSAIPRFPFCRYNDWILLICALPFIVFSFIGFYVLSLPLQSLQAKIAAGGWLGPTLLTASGPVGQGTEHLTALTVMAFAFLGAFFFSARLFLRAIVVFDLSAVTFLRAFVHIALASTVSLLLWRLGTAPGEYQLVAIAAVVVAFFVGFMPDAGLQWLFSRARVVAKGRYIEVEVHAPVIPLTIVDGIDAAVAFRLEEANLVDIQNLSTVNPVMLCVETPYTIFQVIDWVAQAQLCTAVGPEKFLLFRRIGIRTVLDLERAVLGRNASSIVARLVGSVLFADTAAEDRVRDAFGIRPTPLDAPAGAAAASGVAARSAGSAGSVTILQKPVAGIDDDAIEQWVRVIIDDLHVHRLREIWRKIADSFKIEQDQVDWPRPLARLPAPARPDPAAHVNQAAE